MFSDVILSSFTTRSLKKTFFQALCQVQLHLLLAGVSLHTQLQIKHFSLVMVYFRI